MSRAADIYWDSRATTKPKRVARRRTAKAAPEPRRSTPWWLSFTIAVSIFVMLAVTINYRAFTEMRQEADQNTRLASQIESLMDENLALQDEIHTLKTDPKRIEKEARRMGIGIAAASTQQSAVSSQKN